MFPALGEGRSELCMLLDALPSEKLDAWMALALRQARLAEEGEEVPVGAVLVLDGEVVCEACNQMIGSHDPAGHAEMIALRQGGCRLGNYRLPGTLLVVTLEPCLMCYSAMVHARIGGLVYAAADAKTGVFSTGAFNRIQAIFNHRFPVLGGVRGDEASAMLSGFFLRRRAMKA